MDKSLIVTQNGREIFTSNSKWLYPLFELEDFFSKNEFLPETLYLTDKIAGKAAAFLLVRLGLKKVHIQIISEGAIDVFNRFHIDFTFNELVPKIQCKTEEIVSGNETVDVVWQMLRRRAGRVDGLAVDVNGITVIVADKIVLDNLSLKVGKGEHVFIKGANGAGKTTLLKTILGLENATKGTITVGDYEVGSGEWNKKRSVVGYVHQEMIKNNFPISAGEVVEVGLSGHQVSRSELQHRTEIAMRRTGCFHLAKRSYHDLSGGEKQRVNIARCLCQEAKVLLLDEPTSFLDRRAKDELFELLTGLWTNEAPTAIIVSHDDNWIAKFNFIVHKLSDGKIC